MLIILLCCYFGIKNDICAVFPHPSLKGKYFKFLPFDTKIFVPCDRGDEDDDEWEDTDEEDEFDSEDGFSGDEDVDNGREFLFIDEETKSRFTEYSLTSSVMRRNEQLSLLDDRFEKVSACYVSVLVFFF